MKKNSLQDKNSKFILRNNQNITIDGNLAFWKSWFVLIHDLLNSEGNFLSLDEFQRKFNLKVNFLQYFQLLSAIPTDLRKQAFESSNAVLHRDSFISLALKISEDVSLDLMNLRCKNYYKLITEKSTAVPTSIKTWEKQFPVISDNWQKGFSYRDLCRF